MGDLLVKNNGGTQGYRSVQSESKGRLAGRQVKPGIKLMGAVGLLAAGVTMVVVSVLLFQWLHHHLVTTSAAEVIGIGVGALALCGVGGIAALLGLGLTPDAICDFLNDRQENRSSQERMAQCKANLFGYLQL